MSAVSRRQVLQTSAKLGLAALAGANLICWNTANASASGPHSTLDFDTYGKCDGVTDDAPAFRKALSDLADAGGGTLTLPPRTISMTLTAEPTFSVPGNVRIVGTPGTTILLTSVNNDVYVSFAADAGDNVTFEGLKLVRNSDCIMYFFSPLGYDGFFIKNCTINGQKSKFTKNVHGIVLNHGGPKRNIVLESCHFTDLDFGLLQSNTTTADVDSITVHRCSFSGNFGDDLGFNSPNAQMSNVLVTDCRFADNASQTFEAGYGVAFAHVVKGAIRNCSFENYHNEAIHIEDYSSSVDISDNTIITCGTNPFTETATDLDRGGIVVTYGCSDVTIKNNTLDHRKNTNFLHGIVLKRLQGGITASGRLDVSPNRCTISDNLILCGENYQGMWIVDTADVTVTGNKVIGAGHVANNTWHDGNSGFGIMVDGPRSLLSGNSVTGFRYGISGPIKNDGTYYLNIRKALGDPGIVLQNTVSNCYIGIIGVTAGQLTVQNNVISDCVRPMVIGDGQSSSRSCQVIDNVAIGCFYPIEAGEKLVLIRAAGGSNEIVGSEATVLVEDVLRALPVGTVIYFNDGGVLTLTKAVDAPQLLGDKGHPYAIVGVVSSADIGETSFGVTTNLLHTNENLNEVLVLRGNQENPVSRLVGLR